MLESGLFRLARYMNTSNEIMNITAKNANHNIFDLMASSGEAPSYPVANKSWIFCRGLRGTSTFPFFIVTSGLGSILAKNCRGCRRRPGREVCVNADCRLQLLLSTDINVDGKPVNLNLNLHNPRNCRRFGCPLSGRTNAAAVLQLQRECVMC